MRKEEDIYNLYNEIDELFNSMNKKEEIKNKPEEELNVPPIPSFFVNEIEELKKEVHDLKIDVEEEIVQIKEESNVSQTDELYNEVKKSKKEKNRHKKKGKGWVVTFVILDLLAITCLFLMYGPISYFRNLWVTSAMSTMSHKYFANIFFSNEQIQEIMANNTVIEVEGNTDLNEIEIEPEIKEPETYASVEEEQVLKRDPGNDLYKLIPIEGNGYKGHLLVVYDPSKIQLVKSATKQYGLTVQQFVNRNNGVAGINAGGFNYSVNTGYVFTGTVIIDGQIIADNGPTGWGGGIVGFTNDNVLVLSKCSAQEALDLGVRDAVSFGPFLIVNGVASQFLGNGGYGVAPRTAIGQRKDGIVLMLVIDGRRAGHSIGAGMAELTDIMLRYGAYNASNLDGGGSSTIVVGNETLSVAGGFGYTGDRYLPNAWIVTN